MRLETLFGHVLINVELLIFLSTSVTEMQVKDIARTWGISVSNFMRIARSHLSVKHPTATYFLILSDTCADTIQVK